MTAIALLHPNARDERARNLEALGFNGMRLALVDLDPAGSPVQAIVEVFLFNALHRGTIVADAAADPSVVFTVQGGQRIRAGSAEGQVRVTSVANGSVPESLELTIAPIGDYSTYTIVATHAQLDPFFSELAFKFRPGCFNADCAPDWTKSPAPPPQPAIDYLAKDYESFRHTLMAAMAQRVPGWQATSEADLDQVLIDLFAAAGDELSDYQDRVMNEAYLVTCRKRVSLARHARLMDYHLHQGNQASTWLSLGVNAAFTLLPGFRLTGTFDLRPMLEVWSGAETPPPGSVFFAARDAARFDPRLNTLWFYTWDNAVAGLKAGSTSADLVPDGLAPILADAQAVADLINGTDPAVPPVRHLVIQEHLNPATGQEPGRNRHKRQLLELTRADVVEDPVRGRFLVRVTWRDEDALQFDYAFTSFCPDGLVTDISRFHGNLVMAHEGRLAVTSFHPDDAVLPADTPDHLHRHYRWTPYGTLCPIPDVPLAYRATLPGGEIAPVSTLHVEVEMPGGGNDEWDEVISLVHSDDSSENGDHFAVETDEAQQSVLRFGNGVNGREVPAGGVIHGAYQVGGGVAGNAGFDSLVFFDRALFPQVDEVWNPFDVTDGRDPEPVDTVLRNAPEAFRARQLRAITLGDYVRRAEEVDGVSRAAARYMWTGSWRTVRVAIDPVATTELSDDLRTRVFDHLEAVRLIGEDLEIRPPRFVPLTIEVSVCLNPDFWPEDVRFVLEQEFSDAYTPDGRPGFFNPNNWTFGQPLHRSEIEGRIHMVDGVEHIVTVVMKRFAQATPGSPSTEVLEVAADEIVLVENNPDAMERGVITFELQGGRQ